MRITLNRVLVGLLVLIAAILLVLANARADNTPISGLPNGGLIQTTDLIGVARCTGIAGCNYKVTTGSLAALGAGSNLSISGSNLNVTTGNSGSAIPLLNGNLTFSGNDSFTGATTFSAQINANSITIGSPIGGNQGAGTLNGTGLFINGAAVGALSTPNTWSAPQTFASGDLISPVVAGGTGTTSTLTIQPTTGAGTTGANIIFATGNNGGTTDMTILNSGNVGIGTANPGALFTVGANVIEMNSNGSVTIGTSQNLGANTVNVGGNFYVNGTVVSGGGGGSGTVNAGTSGQIGFYAANGNTISGETTTTLAQQNIATRAAITSNIMLNYGGL